MTFLERSAPRGRARAAYKNDEINSDFSLLFLTKHRYMQSTTQSAVHRPSGTRVCNLQSCTTSPCLFVRGEAPLSRERAADSAVVVVRVARHDVHEVVRPHLDVERREMSDAISDGHMLRRASERRGVLAGVRLATM